MNVADRIQALRKCKGLSQEELADKIGVSRQAVSKWESEQSLPDIEKIILLSNYFGVTTDYLLKGIDEKPDEIIDKADARIFSLIGTVFNFIGLIVSIIIWKEEQSPIAVAVGLIVMAFECMIFGIGQFIGVHKEKSFFSFALINIWLLSLIPISCVFNFQQGVTGGYWWTFTPIPQLGNSYSSYATCWLIYILICIIFDIVLIKRTKRKR